MKKINYTERTRNEFSFSTSEHDVEYISSISSLMTQLVESILEIEQIHDKKSKFVEIEAIRQVGKDEITSLVNVSQTNNLPSIGSMLEVKQKELESESMVKYPVFNKGVYNKSKKAYSLPNFLFYSNVNNNVLQTGSKQGENLALVKSGIASILESIQQIQAGALNISFKSLFTETEEERKARQKKEKEARERKAEELKAKKVDILSKIEEKGFESLTKEEKELLLG